MYHGYRTYQELPTLDQDSLDQVERWAFQGITRPDILEGLSIEWDQLDPTEKAYFMERFNYGKISGLANMGKCLHTNASQKSGFQAALAFLGRFSEEWALSQAKAMNPEKISTDGSFNFNFQKPNKDSKSSKSSSSAAPAENQSPPEGSGAGDPSNVVHTAKFKK